MNVATKQWLAAGTTLGAIGLIAGMLAWAGAQVSNATREHRQTTAVMEGLSEQQLVIFEYLLHRRERAREQWSAASDRINRLVAANDAGEPAQQEIAASLRRRLAEAQRTFGELVDVSAGRSAETGGEAVRGRFEVPFLNQLLIEQQDSFADAFRLTELAAARIESAQRRMTAVIAAALALIALVATSAAWLMQHGVLAPLIQLQRVTQMVAAGDLNVRLYMARRDEIGAMAGNIDRMVASLRRSIESSRRKSRDLAALNDELEAFNYSVWHDLRAPLRIVEWFSRELIEEHRDTLDSRGKQALGRVRAANRRMESLIDDLFRLSQVTRAELKQERVDLSAMARAIADALQSMEPHRRVTWEIGPGLRVDGDAALVRIAMENLIGNAWKFTGRNTEATIRVGERESNRRMAFFVSDDGAGFDTAHAERLFEAFQRQHCAADYPGTGIGLAIVRRIVHRHGGRIWAEAMPGKGATFYFTFAGAEGETHG